LGTLDRGACRSAEDVGLQLADAKPILGRLQEIVVSEQLQRYCEAVRPCPRCHRRRHLKDYRRRRFDTVFGRLDVRARCDGCRYCGVDAIQGPHLADDHPFLEQPFIPVYPAAVGPRLVLLSAIRSWSPISIGWHKAPMQPDTDKVAFRLLFCPLGSLRNAH
jgi:hypothetical protein